MHGPLLHTYLHEPSEARGVSHGAAVKVDRLALALPVPGDLRSMAVWVNTSREGLVMRPQNIKVLLPASLP